MKLFLDTADYKKVVHYAPLGVIDGITINPSLLKVQQEPPLKIVQEMICGLPDAEINLQVTEIEPDKVYRQALDIAQYADNMVVKIPCVVEYLPVIEKLIAAEIPVNATLIFSLTQACMMAKMGVTYISLFVGQLDDHGVNGLTVAQTIQDMLDTYDFDSELLIASVRSQEHVQGALNLGADAITMPIAIFEQLVESSYARAGLDKFRQDWFSGPHGKLLE